MIPINQGASGGAPLSATIREEVRRLSKELVEEHRHCDVGNFQRCDIYHDLIETMESVARQVRDAERAKMICGHPAACLEDGICSGCGREQRLTSQAGSMS